MDLVSKDLVGESDPYIVAEFGDKRLDNRDEYILDCSNPRFNKVFNFQARLPGAPTLKISVYDFDDLFGDDLIGTTTIDIDDRFFCPQWRELPALPVEYRQLWVPTSGLSQGSISMFM